MQIIISKKQLDTPPEDFDWEYYIKTHQDLYNAGIKTKKMAECHYLVYKKENRQYKSSSELNKHE